MKLFVLGTASAIVTARRDNTSFVLQAGDKLIMIDGSGNPAGKMLKFGLDPLDLDMILVTHLHVDHCYGLPSILFHLFLEGRRRHLHLASPEEDIEQLKSLLSPHYLYPDARTFTLKLHAVPPEPMAQVFSSDSLLITSAPAEHSRPTRAYRIDDLRSGKSIVFSSDTRPRPEIAELSRNATVLVHESTYTEKNRENAQKFGHSTAKEAAEIAEKAKVSNLVLVHFNSDPGVTAEDFAAEANTVFTKNIVTPEDMEILTF